MGRSIRPKPFEHLTTILSVLKPEYLSSPPVPCLLFLPTDKTYLGLPSVKVISDGPSAPVVFFTNLENTICFERVRRRMPNNAVPRLRFALIRSGRFPQRHPSQCNRY